tara:strand:- start:354 stop:1181 length:828 start_codon:yes stop_codon:yes gene_type:complete
MSEAISIGIIGQGFVGNAVFQKFKKFFEIKTYDLDPNKSNSSFDEVCVCDYIFLCLPTPMNNDGSCNTSIVESVIKKIDERNETVLIVKSTIPPGTTDYWNKIFKSKIVFNPEFLTEKNAVNDYNNQNRIIIGGDAGLIKKIKPIFSKIFPKATIILSLAKEAEMVKYLTNNFLAVKISFANEIYHLCKFMDINFDNVIQVAKIDNRLGNSHWRVPGHDGDLGFGGHCFPKDINAILSLCKNYGSISNVIEAAVKTNDKVRKNRDWEKMKGRAVS